MPDIATKIKDNLEFFGNPVKIKHDCDFMRNVVSDIRRKHPHLSDDGLAQFCLEFLCEYESRLAPEDPNEV